jgi:hypothetical protein
MWHALAGVTLYEWGFFEEKKVVLTYLARFVA